MSETLTTASTPEVAPDVPATDDPTTPSWVQVAVLGGDVHTIDYTPGQTVAQALNAAGVALTRGQVITVNGVPVVDSDQPVQPGSAINVVSAVKNG